jgi:hypothetical protein
MTPDANYPAKAAAFQAERTPPSNDFRHFLFSLFLFFFSSISSSFFSRVIPMMIASGAVTGSAPTFDARNPGFEPVQLRDIEFFLFIIIVLAF